MEDLRSLRWVVAGWSVEDAARRLGVTPRTITNWESGRRRAPLFLPDYYRMAGGLAPTWAPAWRGWRLRCDVLETPAGVEYTPGDVLGIHWLRQLAADRRSRSRAGLLTPLPAPAPPRGGLSCHVHAPRWAQWVAEAERAAGRR